MASRWFHGCPRCHRRISWRKVYCSLCIKQDPELSSFNIRVTSRWLKGARLPGISFTANTLRIKLLLNGNKAKFVVLCLECGHRSSVRTAAIEARGGHRCYWRNSLKRTMTCVICHRKRKVSEFPIINKQTKHGVVNVRAVVCCLCLEGKYIVSDKVA